MDFVGDGFTPDVPSLQNTLPPMFPTGCPAPRAATSDAVWDSILLVFAAAAGLLSEVEMAARGRLRILGPGEILRGRLRFS